MDDQWLPLDFFDSEPALWTDIRARYEDGSETVGHFYQTDNETVWFDKQDNRPAERDDEWPKFWMPLPPPPDTLTR